MKPFKISKEISCVVSEDARVHKDIRKFLSNVIKNEFKNPKFTIVISEKPKASGLGDDGYD